MGKYVKRDLFVYLDIGLVGTFVNWVEKSTEPGFIYLNYVPLNSFPPKKITHPVAIHKDHINSITGSKNFKGIQDNMIVIHTGEHGSALKGVAEENIRTIAELREKLRKKDMQIASLKQEVEDARSGINKTLSSMRAVNKTAEQNPRNPFDSFDRFRQPSPFVQQEEYDDF